MNESDFEGTLVLEKIAAISMIDEFFEALDGDDLATARKLMRAAKVDSETIEIVLKKMEEADGDH